jgi:hypothetical protein
MPDGPQGAGRTGAQMVLRLVKLAALLAFLLFWVLFWVGLPVERLLALSVGVPATATGLMFISGALRLRAAQEGRWSPPPSSRVVRPGRLTSLGVGLWFGAVGVAFLGHGWLTEHAVWAILGAFAAGLALMMVGSRQDRRRQVNLAVRPSAGAATGDEVSPPARPGRPLTGASPPPKRRGRPASPRPRHFFVKDKGSSLRVGCRWIWSRFTGAATMCLVWNCFVVLWYWNALQNGGRMGWLAILITIPHGAIGALLVYATLAGFLNRTVIKVTSELLTVRHGPVPWWGNRRLPIDELERLYCDQDTDSAERGHRYVYRVNALTKGASKVDLVTELDRAQALFIKQELARWLNIDDYGGGREIHA